MNNWFAVAGSRPAAQERFPDWRPCMRQEKKKLFAAESAFFHCPVNLSQDLHFFRHTY
jgi:hypothetical protein